MLIRLRRPVVVGPAVRPLPLGTTCPTPGTKCHISGWGTITSPKSRILKLGDLIWPPNGDLGMG
uniref:Peptidase S1 domain-containing protein n=1 Tax=Phasianus colchicus TaxID=9054 RepID=A0A669R4P8_PHACC